MAIRPQLYQVIARHKNAGNRITIKALADAAGVHYQTLWSWANGETNSVSYTILDALCRELNVTPGDLLAYVPDPTVSPDGHDGHGESVVESEPVST